MGDPGHCVRGCISILCWQPVVAPVASLVSAPLTSLYWLRGTSVSHSRPLHLGSRDSCSARAFSHHESRHHPSPAPSAGPWACDTLSPGPSCLHHTPWPETASGQGRPHWACGQPISCWSNDLHTEAWCLNHQLRQQLFWILHYRLRFG